jgi:PAS domain S-box-containing protein
MINLFKNLAEQFPESKFYVPFMASKETFWCWDINNNDRFTFVSERVKDILGYDKEEMIGRSIYDFIDNDEHAEFRQVLIFCKLDKRPFWEVLTPFIHKSGNVINLGTSGIPLIDEKTGDMLLFRGMAGF